MRCAPFWLLFFGGFPTIRQTGSYKESTNHSQGRLPKQISETGLALLSHLGFANRTAFYSPFRKILIRSIFVGDDAHRRALQPKIVHDVTLADAEHALPGSREPQPFVGGKGIGVAFVNGQPDDGGRAYVETTDGLPEQLPPDAATAGGFPHIKFAQVKPIRFGGHLQGAVAEKVAGFFRNEIAITFAFDLASDGLDTLKIFEHIFDLAGADHVAVILPPNLGGKRGDPLDVRRFGFFVNLDHGRWNRWESLLSLFFSHPNDIALFSRRCLTNRAVGMAEAGAAENAILQRDAERGHVVPKARLVIQYIKLVDPA